MSMEENTEFHLGLYTALNQVLSNWVATGEVFKFEVSNLKNETILG